MYLLYTDRVRDIEGGVCGQSTYSESMSKASWINELTEYRLEWDFVRNLSTSFKNPYNKVIDL